MFLKIWKTLEIGSLEQRIANDAVDRPAYHYCVFQAARLAERLGEKRISVLEFGVAGGRGLLWLERIATEVEKVFDVGIDIYGFDSGTGLPPPEDYRDMPHIWQEGFFEMDVPELKSRLSRSDLVLGNVKDTVPEFMNRSDIAPIGAVMNDLDYYSSSRDALAVLRADPERILPRVLCYMDDVISSDVGMMSDRVGELLSIDEYNQVDEDRYLGKIPGMYQARKYPAMWNEQIYIHHIFSHPKNCQYVHPDKSRQLAL